MAKKKCPECPKGSAKWMTTFSDMTTLLLTFFVLLLSMANFDKRKIEAVFGVFSGSQGILNSPSTTPMSEQNIVARKALEESVEKTQEKMEENMKEYIQAQNLEKMISVIKTDKGISIRVMDSVFFAPGSSELLPEAYPIIDKIINLTEDTSYNINIEGHTDDTPVGRNSPLNWDLSVDRAVSVVKYFIGKDFNPARLSASGFGEYHPILPNITPENRAKNRRIEINVISPELAETGKSVFE
ncbi:MAG: flagellar motor protein MotB [Deferribacterales bacterium]|nr:flagellar motor protein MotB [Deferribacterales bacterium]